MRFPSRRVKLGQIPQVNSSSIFASFFIAMTHNSPVNFKLTHFQLWTKESHQSHNLETFKCSGENSSCYFLNQKLLFLQILHHSLVSSKITFLSQKLPERTNQSAKFTKFLSFLKQQIIFFFKFFHQSWVPSNITPLYFLIWSIIYFGQKQPIKLQNFEIFDCSGQNLLNSLCQFWTSQFLFKFSSFFIVITHNSPVKFKPVHFLIGIKVPIKVPVLSPNFQVL